MRNFKKERRKLLRDASKAFNFNYGKMLKKLKILEESGFVNGKSPTSIVGGLIYAFKTKSSYKIGYYFGISPITVRNNGAKITEGLV